MSWDPTCTGLLQSYPTLDAIAIAGIDGVLYGTSDRANLAPSQAEFTKVINAMKTDNLGITRTEICGQPHIVVRRVDHTVVTKNGKKSVFITCTSKLCMIGVCDESTVSKGGAGLDAMFKLHTYYSSQGY